MKKVKIMLASLCVLGVVGGALAFKATKVQDLFCIGDPSVQGVALSSCTIPTSSVQDNQSASFYAKPTTNLDGCRNFTGNVCGTISLAQD